MMLSRTSSMVDAWVTSYVKQIDFTSIRPRAAAYKKAWITTCRNAWVRFRLYRNSCIWLYTDKKPGTNQELIEHLAHCIEHDQAGVFINPNQGYIDTLSSSWLDLQNPPLLLNLGASRGATSYNLFGDLSDEQVIELVLLLCESEQWMTDPEKREVSVVLFLLLMAMKDVGWPCTYQNLLRAFSAYSTGDVRLLLVTRSDTNASTALHYILQQLAASPTGAGERTRFMVGRVARRLKALKNKILGIDQLTSDDADASFISLFQAPRCVVIEMCDQGSAKSVEYQSCFIQYLHNAAVSRQPLRACRIWGFDD